LANRKAGGQVVNLIKLDDVLSVLVERCWRSL